MVFARRIRAGEPERSWRVRPRAAARREAKTIKEGSAKWLEQVAAAASASSLAAFARLTALSGTLGSLGTRNDTRNEKAASRPPP
jgi:hypothetical protein